MRANNIIFDDEIVGKYKPAVGIVKYISSTDGLVPESDSQILVLGLNTTKKRGLVRNYFYTLVPIKLFIEYIMHRRRKGLRL